MDREHWTSERGEGRLGTLFSLALMAAIAFAAWNVVPIYYNNYAFADRVVELARAPKYSHPDNRIMEELMRSAEEHRIEQYINARTCKVNTLETRRTIVCEYEREVQVLPGWTHTFHFKNDADQPLI